MFTGLIEDVGTLVDRVASGRAARLRVRTSLPVEEIRVGDSIAVNGACLTVEAAGGGLLCFHCLHETLSRTNLATAAAGAQVNLERALRLGDRLGGHLVSGHVDATAGILTVGKTEDDIAVRIKAPASLRELLIPKGSIAVNGISLTIAEVERDAFSVRLIPHTWGATNLRTAKTGDSVNLEGDMIGKFVLRRERLRDEGGNVLGMDSLGQAGFFT